MIIKLGAKNRITIPREICEQLQWVHGDDIDVEIDTNNNIVFRKVDKITHTTQLCNENITTADTRSNFNDTDIKSNLEDVGKYSVQVYSDCRKVVKTKRKYINNFCDKCQGRLVIGDDNANCKFRTSKDVLNNSTELKSDKEDVTNFTNTCKDVVQDIEYNVSKLKDKINDKINDKQQHRFFNSCTTMKPVKFNKPVTCDVCGDVYSKGFLINGVHFYCKACTIQDFKDFMSNYKNKEC